jgi:hypothetical protein
MTTFAQLQIVLSGASHFREFLILKLHCKHLFFCFNSTTSMSNAIQLTGFEPLCRLRSHLLETKITYLDSYIQYVAVSSNGRYVYIPSDKDIIIIDVIDGIERYLPAHFL